MTAPVTPAVPAAPAPDAAPSKPGSLLDAQRGLKALRVAPVKAPSVAPGQSSIKVNGKTLTTPTPAQKAGAPAPTPQRAENGQFVAQTPPPAPAAPGPQGEGAKAAVDAKRAVTAQVMGEPEQPRKYKVKVDGQEREVLDSELVQNYQIRQHLNKELQSIAEYRNMAKKDFDGLVRKLAEEYGQNPEAVAERLLMKKAEAWQEEQMLKDMSPEQREYYQLKKEKEQRDAQTAEEKRIADEKAANEAHEASARATYEKTTNILIEAHKLLPEGIRNHPDFNAQAFGRVKDRLAALASQVPGNTPIDEFLASVDVKELARGALADHRAELRLAIETAGEEDWESLIPDAVLEKIIAKRRAAVAARHPQLQARPQVGNGKKPAEEKPEPKPLSSFKPSMASMINRGRR